MAMNAAWLQVIMAAGAGVITHVQLHSGAPGAAGTDNVISGGRFAVDLSSSGGTISLDAAVEASGLTPEATVANVSFWTAGTGGTYYGFVPRTSGDTAVNAAGEYTINSLSLPSSAS